MDATVTRLARAKLGRLFATFRSRRGQRTHFVRALHLDGSLYTLFETLLSLSRKIRIIIASSRMVEGVSQLHWSNGKPALTAKRSS
jgi:hypothetical protein